MGHYRFQGQGHLYVVLPDPYPPPLGPTWPVRQPHTHTTSSPLSNKNTAIRHPQGESPAWNIQDTKFRLKDSLSLEGTEHQTKGLSGGRAAPTGLFPYLLSGLGND